MKNFDIIEQNDQFILARREDSYYIIHDWDDFYASAPHPWISGLDEEKTCPANDKDAIEKVCKPLTLTEAMTRWGALMSYYHRDSGDFITIDEWLYQQGFIDHRHDKVADAEAYFKDKLETRGGARKGCGRKAGQYGPRGKSIGKMISLSESEWEELDDIATRRGLTRSDLVREAIKRIADEESD